MPSIRPFRGIFYDKHKVKDVSRVVAPPYDVIPPEMQSELYRKSPYNIVRLILGKVEESDDERDNRYSRARKFLDAWLSDGVMKNDAAPAFYVYSQQYRIDSKKIERFGFLALMKLDTSAGKKILPHENTLAAPKLDRLNLIREVKASLSPIFILFEDAGHRVSGMLKNLALKTRPLMDVEFENVRNRVWRMIEPRDISRIEDIMKNKRAFIADGHHRYEVACTYAAEAQGSDLPARVKDAAKFMMAYFVEMDERMLTILPAHRVVRDMGGLKRDDVIKRLAPHFQIKRAAGLEEMLSLMKKSGERHVFGLFMKGGFYILILKDERASDRAVKGIASARKRLDVSILHSFVLQHILGVKDSDENIEYVKDPKKAVGLAKDKKGKAVFLLNPTRLKQVRDVAKKGERMPKKATYFYPKPLSGLVINRF